VFRWLSDLAQGTGELCLFGQECRFSLRPGQGMTLPCMVRLDGAGPADAPGLDEALAAVRATVGRRRIGLKVRLGGALLYQDAVRIDGARLSRDALRAVLASHWQAALGDALGPVAISYSMQRGGGSVVTSCTTQALLQQIRVAAQAHGFGVASVAPFSAAIWNAHRRAIHDRSGYLVVCEHDFVTIGAYEDGAWSAWASESREGGEWGDVARSVQRFARCRGLDEDLPVWVAPGMSDATGPASAGLARWKVLGAAAAAAEVAA
jgi:hypothetical protein